MAERERTTPDAARDRDVDVTDRERIDLDRYDNDNDNDRRHDHDRGHDRERVVERREGAAAAFGVDRARGGVSFWSILSGVLVSFGAFIVLAALIGGILGALGVTEGGLTTTDMRNATIGAGIGVIIAQFLAYLWGGYTAGRMARGSGVLNGLLVPLVAIILVAILGAIVVTTTANLDVDAQAQARSQLGLPLSDLADIGTGIGIGVLIAMFLGGGLGGWLGARWHTKLENAGRTAHRDEV